MTNGRAFNLFNFHDLKNKNHPTNAAFINSKWGLPKLKYGINEFKHSLPCHLPLLDHQPDIDKKLHTL